MQCSNLEVLKLRSLVLIKRRLLNLSRLHKLKFLELYNMNITTEVLQETIKGCPNLETLRIDYYTLPTFEQRDAYLMDMYQAPSQRIKPNRITREDIKWIIEYYNHHPERPKLKIELLKSLMTPVGLQEDLIPNLPPNLEIVLYELTIFENKLFLPATSQQPLILPQIRREPDYLPFLPDDYFRVYRMNYEYWRMLGN